MVRHSQQLDAVVSRARRFGSLPYSALAAARHDSVYVDAPSAAAGGWLRESVDRWWYALGRPDPFVVVEAGAGDGTRAAEVLAGHLGCARALRYLLVENKAEQRAKQSSRLRLERPELVLGQGLQRRSWAGETPAGETPAGGEDDLEDDFGQPPAMAGNGPMAASLPWLPSGLAVGVIIAFEVVSAIGYDVLVFKAGRWCELRLIASEGGNLSEVAVPLEEGSSLPAALSRLDPVEGEKVAWWGAAQRWLAEAASTVEDGFVVIVDRFEELTSAFTSEPALVALDQLSLPRRRPRVTNPVGIFPLRAAEWELLSRVGSLEN